MDWAIDALSEIGEGSSKDRVRLMRETLEAKVKADTGHYSEAARILWELLVEVRRSKQQEAECLTMIHMGKVYRVLRWKIATCLFEEALELSEKIQFPRAKMMALVELGELKCQWGLFEESLELFTKAMALVEEGDQQSRRIILLNTVVAHEGLDDIETCRRLLQEVIAIDRVIGCEDMDEDISHLERITEALEGTKG